MKVSIVIPNYNGEELLKKNLPLVVKAKNFAENNIGEVIVVDDGSTDGSLKLITSQFPEVRVIKHKINRGFPAAINTGVRSSKGEFVVLLNNDVSPQENFLKDSFKHFSQKDVFGVSFHEKGYGWARGIFSEGFVGHEAGSAGDSSHQTFWVSGGSGIFRRDLFVKLGGMDEKLFTPFYWEDLDICYRALKRGYKLIWEPECIVDHEHESTVSKLPKVPTARIRERNQLLFIWKNITSASLTRKHVGGIFKRLSKSPGYIRIIFMALAKFKDVIKARRKEGKETRISDEAIFARFK
jgi:GT2 family glycosyltransferase